MLMTHFLSCFLFLSLTYLNLPADSRHPTNIHRETMSRMLPPAAQTPQSVNNTQTPTHENTTRRKRLVSCL